MGKDDRKRALILASGAMRGAYQCGVLKAFEEQGIFFHVVVASSVGAYNGVRYLARQMDVCEEIFVRDCSGRRFVKPWNLLLPRRHVLDLDYLVDEVCSRPGKEIDMACVRNSPSRFYIAALDRRAKVTRFFDAKAHDIHLLLKATSAIPFLYKGQVVVEGRAYLDGGLRAPIPVVKALDLGCTDLWVVLNKAPSAPDGGRPWALTEHERIRKKTLSFLAQNSQGRTVCLIYPRRGLPVGRFTTEASKIRRAVEIGYEDGKEALLRAGEEGI